jgi:hypothetical protein
LPVSLLNSVRPEPVEGYFRIKNSECPHFLLARHVDVTSNTGI